MRPDQPPPEFRLLLRLRDSAKIDLMVPEMAAREWLSQRVQPVGELLDQLEQAMLRLQRNPSLASHSLTKAIISSELHEPRTIAALREASEMWHRDQLDRLQLSTIKLQPEDYQATIEGYFQGHPPFSGKKARNDLPDALILSGALRVFLGDPRAVFVCNDNRLRQSAQAKGVQVAASLPELLKLDVLFSLHTNAAFALWWEEHFYTIVRALRDRSVQIEPLIETCLTIGASGIVIRHQEIPGDNQEAYAEVVGDFTDLDFEWEAAESLGEGIVSIPMTFKSFLSLQFSVYRGDAFSMPDWVQVTHGDYEDDHYFRAHGTREAEFSGRLVLEVSERVMDKGLDLDDADLSVQDVLIDDFAD